jgi:hypothetical protein
MVVINGASDPQTLEMTACREALALSEVLSLAKIYVASNCKVAVTDINEGGDGKEYLHCYWD